MALVKILDLLSRKAATRYNVSKTGAVRKRIKESPLLFAVCMYVYKVLAPILVLVALPRKEVNGHVRRDTDRATAACRQSNCQLVQIEGATWSA
jgi:hypothetical protein